jgi:hypothetical protein
LSTVQEAQKADGRLSGVAQAWYLTKAGRAQFAVKVAIRDENPYTRSNRLADEAKRRKLAEVHEQPFGWWRDARMWMDLEVDHDPTMTEAIRGIALQCPNWAEARDAEERAEHEAWSGSWQSEWLDELGHKAEVKAVLLEAEAYLRQPRRAQLTPALE